MARSVAEVEITAATGGLAAGLNTAARMLGGFASTSASALGSVAKSIANVGVRAAGHLVGTMATRGLDFMVEQGQNVLKFEEALVRLGLASRKSGAELRAIGDNARALSTATGLDALEVLRGARAYIDLAGAENYTAEKMSLIARTSQAAGADIGDVATVVYSLTNALQIAGPELEDTIGGLLNQSKSGAIHFTQMASEMVSLAPSFAQFGVKGREGAIRLGAALQIVRTGFGSAAEAGTGMQRLMRSLPQHAHLFEKGGVQIFKKGSRSELLSLDQIMENIYKSKLRLDRPALIKAFGRGEAERAFQLFQGSGTDEEGKIVDNIEKYHQLIEAGRENGTVQKDLATFTESSSGKIAESMEKMKNAVAVAFTPERVAGFAEALTRAADAFMVAAHWVDSHIDVAPADVRQMHSDEFYNAVVGQQDKDHTTPEVQAIRARQLQNWHMGDADTPDYINRLVNEQTAPGHDETEESVTRLVHEVGRRLGAKLKSQGVSGSISAGAMIEEDNERNDGVNYLKKIGISIPEIAKNAEDGGKNAMVEGHKALAGAVRDALAPSLDRIATVLRERMPAPVVMLNGSAIAQSFENSPHRRARP